jgi:hypothetical protein
MNAETYTPIEPKRTQQQADFAKTPRTTRVRLAPAEPPAFSVWLNSRQAAAYVPCPTLNAWYMWRNRHGIVPRANGSVAKADIDRALSLRNKKRKRVSPKSIANLRRRHADPLDWIDPSLTPATAPVVGGSELGFRIAGIDSEGRLTGTLVVRVTGTWVEVASAIGTSPRMSVEDAPKVRLVATAKRRQVGVLRHIEGGRLTSTTRRAP